MLFGKLLDDLHANGKARVEVETSDWLLPAGQCLKAGTKVELEYHMAKCALVVVAAEAEPLEIPIVPCGVDDE